jgi:hypothetical protein
MTTETKKAASSKGAPPTDRLHQRGHVHVSALVSALLAEQPELATLYNIGDLDRLASEFALRLVWAARLERAGKGM